MIKTLFIVFSAVLLIYLLLPAPTKVKEFNALPDALKSDEPGDTYQVSGSIAYFTNFRRLDLIPFYFNIFNNKSSFFEIPLPVIRLNYPPEHAREVIRPYIQSWYIEEFIHPFRESLYVSGWEPFDEQGVRRNNQSYGIEVNGKAFSTKINLKYITSPLWTRLVTWFMITISFYLLFRLSKKVFNG